MAAEAIAVRGARILLSPGAEPVAHGTVVVRDGVIDAVGPDVEPPPGARVRSGSGRSVAAGFWNAHVHFTERKWAAAVGEGPGVVLHDGVLGARLPRSDPGRRPPVPRSRGSAALRHRLGYMTDYRIEDELRPLSGCGVGSREILAMLTTAPAERFGASGRKGTIAPGMDGDLVVMEGDPLRDPAAFARVCATIRAGRLLHETP